MKRKSKTIFALDIGTRTIVGLVLEEKDKNIYIKEIISREHSNRAMLDGQIHNIPQVSALVKEIKKELEGLTGTRLKKVAVAAAGRSLKTIKTMVSYELDNQIPIKDEDVLNYELRAAQKAQKILLDTQNSEDSNEYYCVGFSIIKYYLDDEEIGSLIGQRGTKAGLEIVAAFLPKVVVESLQAVLSENGVELANITLEPIAAINAILPQTMRKLNLALVDIGAGTSDIAISYDGSIVGYGMVPIAGDEITEALCEQYLLDFNEGENLKRKLGTNLDNNLNFTDILGIEHSLQGAQILKNISASIKSLAEKIAQQILELNTKSPQAVILIGGGSLTPLLAEFTADLLGLPKERVAVQRASAIKEVENLPIEFHGPEIITPIGIGITAVKNFSLGFIPVEVNGHSMNLLNLGKNTVLDALLAAGIDTGKPYGKPGLALTIEVNGKIKTFPGTLGEKAYVKVNGAIAGLDTLLRPRDKIEFFKAEDGKSGNAKVKDLIQNSHTVSINGERRILPFEITINNKTVTELNTDLKESNKVYIREINQVGELLELWQIIEPQDVFKITLIFNNQEKNIIYNAYEILRNNKPIDSYDTINHNDEISIYYKDNSKYSVKDLLENEIDFTEQFNITVFVNGSEVTIPIVAIEIKINDINADMNSILNNGDIIKINYIKQKNPILVDIFPRIDFSTNPPPGKTRLDIYVNDKEVDYTTMLNNGDKVKLIWR